MQFQLRPIMTHLIIVTFFISLLQTKKYPINIYFLLHFSLSLNSGVWLAGKFWTMASRKNLTNNDSNKPSWLLSSISGLIFQFEIYLLSTAHQSFYSLSFWALILLIWRFCDSLSFEVITSSLEVSNFVVYGELGY